MSTFCNTKVQSNVLFPGTFSQALTSQSHPVTLAGKTQTFSLSYKTDSHKIILEEERKFSAI